MRANFVGQQQQNLANTATLGRHNNNANGGNRRSLMLLMDKREGGGQVQEVAPMAATMFRPPNGLAAPRLAPPPSGGAGQILRPNAMAYQDDSN